MVNSMTNSHQRGNTEMWLLFSLVMTGIVLFSFVSDGQEAPAEDVVALVSLAESAPEAKSKLRAFLQETPHPTRKELRRFKGEINALIVSSTVKSVTGAASVAPVRERAPWNEHWLAVFAMDNWRLLVGVGLFLIVLLHPITRSRSGRAKG